MYVFCTQTTENPDFLQRVQEVLKSFGDPQSSEPIITTVDLDYSSLPVGVRYTTYHVPLPEDRLEGVLQYLASLNEGRHGFLFTGHPDLEALEMAIQSSGYLVRVPKLDPDLIRKQRQLNDAPTLYDYLVMDD